MAQPPMADLFGRMLGEFILRERICEGNDAVIYRCEQPVLKRDVVVQVLRARRRRSDPTRDRFLCEAQLASRLDHPYAAHVYACGAEEDGLLWLAMELVQGVSLDQWLQTRGPMPLDQFVPFFECVAHVVHAAHERGIVHRDLKPSNVMVIERGGQLYPKLLDIGITKLSSDPTEPVLQSDPPYTSPEQWLGAAVIGPASDIYSLGALAYETLTGRTPFRAETSEAYRRLHLEVAVPSLGGEFSFDLDRVVRRALAKPPEARHRDALELASELRATLRAQPREQLRSLAQVWDDRARSPALLLKSADLMRAPTGVIGELERAFVAASQRHAARRVRSRRFVAATAAALVVGAVWYRAELKTEIAEQRTRAAQQIADVTVTQAELEQGRSALLHNEPEAQLHLTEAYRRDPSPSTAFMLARAIQPWLAEQAQFASTSGRMWSAVFSPDGTQIVTTDDKNAQVWDAATYQRRFVLPHGDTVYHAIYSPDGTRIITAGGDGQVRIWDAASGALVRALSQHRRDGQLLHYGRVAASLDGKSGSFAAAIDIKGDVVHVWDTRTGALLAELRCDGLEYSGLAFSADGGWLAATGGDDAQVFDTRTWTPIRTIHGPRIRRLAFDPTGPRLLTGAATGDLAVWDIPSGARIHHLREIGDPIDAVAFSPDGRLIVAASRDGTEQIWRAGSGELQAQFHPRHSKILAVEFDRSSQLVLAAGVDGTAVVANAALGMPIAVLEGPHNALWSAHFDPSSQRVVAASWDGTARIWDATSPYLRWSSPPMGDDCGIGTSSEPDRRFIAVGCRDHPTRVWDTSRDQLLAELPSVSHVEGDFTSAFPAVSRAGDRAAIARGNAIEIYELPSGRLVRTVAHAAPVNAVAFAPTGQDVVSGAIDGSVRVLRDSGALLSLPLASGGIDAVALLPDGRVVTSDARRRLRVFEPGGDTLADFELPVRAMSLRAEGARLVAIPIYTGNAAPPLLVDLEHYRVLAQLEGHVGWVYSARWVAGDQILTAGGDATVRLWDGATGRLRQIYRGGSRLLADATLMPEIPAARGQSSSSPGSPSTTGGLVIAGDGDGVLRFWDATTGRPLWLLQAHKSLLVGLHIEGDDIVTRGFTGELSRWTLPSSEQVIRACGGREHCAIVRR
jgi:WD40 repeat protein/tRNA A-37 threonylcarbamoyl transferase component Bud32